MRQTSRLAPCHAVQPIDRVLSSRLDCPESLTGINVSLLLTIRGFLTAKPRLLFLHELCAGFIGKARVDENFTAQRDGQLRTCEADKAGGWWMFVNCWVAVGCSGDFKVIVYLWSFGRCWECWDGENDKRVWEEQIMVSLNWYSFWRTTIFLGLVVL